MGGNAPFQPQTTVINGNADAPAGATPRVFPFTMTVQDPVFKIPTAWNWNATFQREVGWGTTVELGYVGRRGIHNQRKRNINQLLPGTLQANRGVNANALRPYLGMGIIGIAENSGLSMYDGLQVSIERHFATGLQFGMAYTYSRSTDNGSSLTDVIPNAYDDRGYYGLSDFDRTHVLIFNYIYEVPFFRTGTGWAGRVIGGWELSGIFQAQSGTPFSVRKNVDYAGVGPGSGNQFWNVVGDPGIQTSAFTNSAVWFNTECICAACRRHVWRSGTEHPAQPRILELGLGATQKFRNYGESAAAVPVRGLQRRKSPELGRSGFKPNLRLVRTDHQ